MVLDGSILDLYACAAHAARTPYLSRTHYFPTYPPHRTHTGTHHATLRTPHHLALFCARMLPSSALPTLRTHFALSLKRLPVTLPRAFRARARCGARRKLHLLRAWRAALTLHYRLCGERTTQFPTPILCAHMLRRENALSA